MSLCSKDGSIPRPIVRYWREASHGLNRAAFFLGRTLAGSPGFEAQRLRALGSYRVLCCSVWDLTAFLRRAYCGVSQQGHGLEHDRATQKNVEKAI